MKIQRVLLIAPAALLVAACGAAATTSDSTATSASAPHGSAERAPSAFANSEPQVSSLAPVPAEAAPVTIDATAGSGASAGSTDSSAGGAQSSAVGGPAIISKGQISLTTHDIPHARFQLQELLDGWNGTIANEQSTADKKGHTDESRLELRIPSSHFDDAMNAISNLGTLVSRNRSSEDVTTQVIDNNTRVRSQKLSIARIQALLAQAQNLTQVISIESELSQRQADLDSLEQQQKYLADQTSLATIDLYLSTPGKAVVIHHGSHHSFWSGLKSGWNHLGTSTAAVLDAVGTALPFGIVLALIGAPGWLVWRRRTPKAALPAPSEA